MILRLALIAVLALVFSQAPYAALIATAYFTPAIIALARDHHNALAIFALNLFAGWTFVGWVAALVWACYRERKVV